MRRSARAAWMGVFSLLGWIIMPVYAANTDAEHFFREWSKIDVTGPYSTDWSDFRYEVFFESRNKETRLDYSTGYRFTPLASAWGGFTWISPNDGSPQFYRPWEQVIWELFQKNSDVLFQTRTRVEQLKQEFQPEWLWRVRERWRLALPEKLPRQLTPVVYDEMFFNVNRPVWVSTRTIDQNRVFVGVDTKPWKNSFVEVGYINQYIFSEPKNRVAHILSISLMVELKKGL